jgi:competence protein ComEA
MVGELLQKYRLPIGLGLVGIVMIIGGIVTSGGKTREYPKESLIQTPKTISVDVSGAVGTPGVYQIQDGSRIEDAIVSAGGFNEEANIEYISKYLNMAQIVSDGTKIYVPFEGEQPARNAGVSVAGGGTNTSVNINTATQAELEALPGIGPVTASKIISGRPYAKVEDLQNEKIVSKTVFEKIKDVLVVY